MSKIVFTSGQKGCRAMKETKKLQEQKAEVIPFKITKDLSILEVLQAYPEVRSIFIRHGMGCLECMGAMAETIETGARMHGIDLEELLADLNKAIQKG